MPIAYKWHLIDDLVEDPKSLTDRELESLGRVWAKQKTELAESGALDEFDKRLRREWAIETGIIEGVYTLDRGVTRTLIEKGIEAALIPHDATNRDPELVGRILQDHSHALEGMFDFVGGQRQLSTSYIKELQAALLRSQTTYTVTDQFGQKFEKRLEKGLYKDAPNNPSREDGSVHEFCPPEHVASEMDRLLQMHIEHESRSVPVEVEAAWLHHRFTQIHPFADGNGRVARAIASLVFIKAGWFPLVVTRDDRTRYIVALEKADAADLRPLIAIFVEAQRKAIIQAGEAAYDLPRIPSPHSPHEAITAARDRLVQRGRLSLNEWLAAKASANELYQFAVQRVQKIVQDLQEQIPASTGFTFESSSGFRYSDAALRARAVQNAGYVANYQEFDASVQLLLNTKPSTVLALSFHGIGPSFRGLIGVMAYFVPAGAEPILVEGGTFLINYEEDLAAAQIRFSAWLERVILEGLNQWRR